MSPLFLMNPTRHEHSDSFWAYNILFLCVYIPETAKTRSTQQDIKLAKLDSLVPNRCFSDLSGLCGLVVKFRLHLGGLVVEFSLSGAAIARTS